jgi:hypothetical protein
MAAKATANAPIVMAMETPRLDQLGPPPRPCHPGPFVASTDPVINPAEFAHRRVHR